MSSTATAILGFAGWFVLLTLAMAIYRSMLIATGSKAVNGFAPDGSDLDGFGRRLTRARDNCFETLPVFVAIAWAASSAGQLSVTDPLAMWVLLLRIAQSTTHIISASPSAVLVRAGFFFAQMLIYLWWILQLLG